jgi:hypothetical protein
MTNTAMRRQQSAVSDASPCPQWPISDLGPDEPMFSQIFVFFVANLANLKVLPLMTR